MKLIAILLLTNSLEAISLRKEYNVKFDTLFSDDGEAEAQTLASIKSSEKVLQTTYNNQIPSETMAKMMNVDEMENNIHDLAANQVTKPQTLLSQEE